MLAGVSGCSSKARSCYRCSRSASFHLGAGGVGAFIAAFGVGALPGALAAARGDGHPGGRLILRLAVLTGLSMLLTAVAPDPALAFASMVVTGFVSILFIAATNTFVQLTAPAPLRGRVMGVWTMALPGMNPVTGLAAGFLADAAGPRIAYAAAAGLFLLAAAAGRNALRGATSTGASDAPSTAAPPVVAVVAGG